MTKQTSDLARSITRTSSIQSFYTARLMVDKELEDDCYRAYGYFRWVDDVVDDICKNKADRLSFIARQKHLATILYRGEEPSDLTDMEKILADTSLITTTIYFRLGRPPFPSKTLARYRKV